MANRWGNRTVTDFIFGGSKITADGGRSHEIKRRLLLGRKVMTNLDSILKSRDIMDNMLNITNDGRKLALDQRLLNPILPDFEAQKDKVSHCFPLFPHLFAMK